MNGQKLRVLDLFSGIGGFSLGLERAGGFETVAFCEIEPYCRKILAKHWPCVKQYDDVRTLTADTLARDGIAVDVICGGFPCQDLSLAGKRAGLEGERSGLWYEYARLIGEIRPRFVIVENVTGLLNLGMGDVLGSLSALGYDAVWDCIPACAVGAPHRRDRVWIVAYNNQKPAEFNEPVKRRSRESEWDQPSRRGQADVADADSDQRKRRGCDVQMGGQRIESQIAHDDDAARIEWPPEPAICRVADGVPDRLDRLKALGNAVVPQISELIGKAIMQAEALA